MVQGIVKEAQRLCRQYTSEYSAPVNYACIFSQNPEEYEALMAVVKAMGPMVKETEMGSVFHIAPLSTCAGELRLLKIRCQDPNRPERGDADFTVSNYPQFKQEYLGQPGFGLIEREEMEMMELRDPAFNVLAYFSYPTLYKVLGLRST